MNGDSPELCDIYPCLCAVAKKELVLKRQGRGCACHISKMQQGTEAGRILCSNFDQQWPFKAEKACSMDTAQSKPQQPRELYPGGQCPAGTAKPPDGRGNLIELAGSHPLCSPFPRDK